MPIATWNRNLNCGVETRIVSICIKRPPPMLHPWWYHCGTLYPGTTSGTIPPHNPFLCGPHPHHRPHATSILGSRIQLYGWDNIPLGYLRVDILTQFYLFLAILNVKSNGQHWILNCISNGTNIHRLIQLAAENSILLVIASSLFLANIIT